MRFSSFFSIALAVCLCLASVQSANAQNQAYELFFGQSSYSVDPGETVDVSIFLRETGNGSTPRQMPGGGDALFSFDIVTDFSSVSGGSPGATVNAAGDIALNPNFTFFNGASDVTINETNVQFQGTEDFANDADNEFGVSGNPTPSADIFELELATLTFTAGATGTATNLSLSAGDEGILFADSFSPANAIFGSSQILVGGAAVPEPSSLIVVGGLCCGVLLRRRRRS